MNTRMRRIDFAKELIQRYKEHYKAGVLSKEEMKCKVKELKLFITEQRKQAEKAKQSETLGITKPFLLSMINRGKPQAERSVSEARTVTGILQSVEKIDQ